MNDYKKKANPQYASIRYDNGKESTVSIKDIAPLPPCSSVDPQIPEIPPLYPSSLLSDPRSTDLINLKGIETCNETGIQDSPDDHSEATYSQILQADSNSLAQNRTRRTIHPPKLFDL